ncbi:hypothetical protein BDN70DRAFT_820616, partial [Pholiota conissans]
EHAIGFLKGRFQSLKGLCINIVDEASHKFATYWVISCIGLHVFAMDCEVDEPASSSNNEDPFVCLGLSTASDSDFQPSIPMQQATVNHQT